jgi:hypothetical protein
MGAAGRVREGGRRLRRPASARGGHDLEPGPAGTGRGVTAREEEKGSSGGFAARGQRLHEPGQLGPGERLGEQRSAGGLEGRVA